MSFKLKPEAKPYLVKAESSKKETCSSIVFACSAVAAGVVIERNFKDIFGGKGGEVTEIVHDPELGFFIDPDAVDEDAGRKKAVSERENPAPAMASRTHKPRIILMTGPADSGKSTWCKKHGIFENDGRESPKTSARRAKEFGILAIDCSWRPAVEMAEYAERLENEGCVVSFRRFSRKGDGSNSEHPKQGEIVRDGSGDLVGFVTENQRLSPKCPVCCVPAGAVHHENCPIPAKIEDEFRNLQSDPTLSGMGPTNEEREIREHGPTVDESAEIERICDTVAVLIGNKSAKCVNIFETEKLQGTGPIYEIQAQLGICQSAVGWSGKSYEAISNTFVREIDAWKSAVEMIEKGMRPTPRGEVASGQVPTSHGSVNWKVVDVTDPVPTAASESARIAQDRAEAGSFGDPDAIPPHLKTDACDPNIVPPPNTGFVNVSNEPSFQYSDNKRFVLSHYPRAALIYSVPRGKLKTNYYIKASDGGNGSPISAHCETEDAAWASSAKIIRDMGKKVEMPSNGE